MRAAQEARWGTAGGSTGANIEDSVMRRKARCAAAWGARVVPQQLKQTEAKT